MIKTEFPYNIEHTSDENMQKYQEEIISWFNTKFSKPGQPNNGNSINNKNNITTVLLETFRKDVIFFVRGTCNYQASFRSHSEIRFFSLEMKQHCLGFGFMPLNQRAF